MTLEEKKNRFIRKAVEKYGNKFDYSKVDYKQCNEKVCIICPEHGEFWQTPILHLSTKHGCPECGKKESIKISKTEDFIKKAKEVHGNKYDYSKTEYKGCHEKICIICPEHGEFWQTPINHIAKHQQHGCPECGKEKCKNIAYNKKDYFMKNFINKSKLLYGEKYDYTNINYVNSQTPIKLVCKEHGEFETKPVLHLSGHECPICQKNIKYNVSCKEKTKIFKEKAKLVHGDKYDYSKSKYVNSSTKVCIICPEHGEFWQRPDKHLQGRGCSLCYSKKREIYTYNYCFEIAEKYTSHMDFRRFDSIAYYKSKSNGWLDDYTWLENIESTAKTQTIYVYEFPNKHAYVGLTFNLHKRDVQHRYNKNKDSVFKYSEKNNVEIPKPKILETNLTRLESKEKEQYWADFYKNAGFTLINKCKCGSLGGNIKQNDINPEDVILEAKKYKNQEQMYRENRVMYNKMVNYNLKKECFPNTNFRVLAIKNNYTDDFILDTVMKYNTKNELRLNNFTVYHWLWSHKKLYEYFDKISGKNFLKK